jgi:PAS domain-containing protein
MAEGVVVMAADGTITAVNPAAERIEGRSAEEMLGKTSQALERGAIREDGTPFPGEEHPAMVTLRAGQGVDSQRVRRISSIVT